MQRKILMLLENNPYSRDIRVRQEARALEAAGYRVMVICPKAPQETFFAQEGNVFLYRFPAPPAGESALGYLLEYGYSLVVTFILTLFVAVRHGFDAIHAHNPPDIYVFIGILGKLFGSKFVYDHHDLSPELYMHSRFSGRANPFLTNTLIFFEKLSCRWADQVIVTNESYRDVDMERSNLPESKITIVRNGPDLNKLKPVDIELSDPHRVTLGYLGMIGRQDGVDNFIKVIDILVHRFEQQNFKCIIVGEGAALADVKALAASLQVDPFIEFVGWVEYDQVNYHLNRFDVCIAPEMGNEYTTKCTTIKIMEYMAVGKPIVAFDLIEHQRSAREGALYASHDDLHQFAEHVNSLIESPAKREAVGKAGYDRVTTVLNWSNQANALVSMYDRLLRVPTRLQTADREISTHF